MPDMLEFNAESAMEKCHKARNRYAVHNGRNPAFLVMPIILAKQLQFEMREAAVCHAGNLGPSMFYGSQVVVAAVGGIMAGDHP